MLTITELSENQIYVESDRWQCSFGYGDPVRLGLVLEAVDAGDGKDGGFSYVVDAGLIPQLDFLDREIVEEAKAEGLASREEMLRYAYECYGGVPVNIDAVQPPKASCGMSGFVAESRIGTVTSEKGEIMEARRFQDREEAMSFARDFYAIYAPVIFGFIDVLLDSPLLAGGTGWDKIRNMAGR
ncbi:MAG TPA: hypothetical protein PKK11_07270 [Methanothrix sp.]|nr:hypothetical protein [Methanothrix sp.]HPT19662.1 hypothetical protein [Methanothrix sp.]